MVTKQEIAEKIKQNGKYWIVFTGDSITSCEWVHPNWREIVEYVLKDKLDYDWGLKAFNFAYDGSTSKDLVAKTDELITLKPDIVICLTGANDPFQGISVDEFKNNVIQIKKVVEGAGSDFVLSTDNMPWNDWAAEKYLRYVEVLGSVDKNFINLFNMSANFPKDRIYTFISEQDIPEERIKRGELDFWHPNQLGNAYIAKVILKEVFDIAFDPERYWENTQSGKKLPGY